MAAKPKTVTRDVGVYYSENGDLFVERSGNSMSVVRTPAEALALVKQDDAKISKRRKAIVITKIDWHHLPAYMVTEIGAKR